MRHSLDGEPARLHIRPQLLATGLPGETRVAGAALAVDGRVLVHDADHRQLVSLADLVVVWIVCRGDLRASITHRVIDVCSTLVASFSDSRASDGRL